jgi:3-ketosteroid 9alpha-monooxygenase subunit A
MSGRKGTVMAAAELALHGLSLDLKGWFQVAWSSELRIGDVSAKHYFGRDLVLYRGHDGRVRAHDRYCRHLGASLAHGGVVTAEGIQCPFHGWVWGPDGGNVSVPYQARPSRVRLVAWQVRECNESIYLWNDPAGGAPSWDIADALSLTSHAAGVGFHPAGDAGRSHFSGLRVHPQMVVENAVDPHHFRFVHRTPLSPVVLGEVVEGATWWSRVGFGRRWADVQPGSGEIPDDPRSTIEIHWQGMGVSANTEYTRDGIRVIAINTTPVDDGCTELFASYWIDRHDGDLDDGSYLRRLNEAKSAVPDDLNIWNHQRYLEAPALATDEAPGFARVRRWAGQFYPAAAAARADPELVVQP